MKTILVVTKKPGEEAFTQNVSPTLKSFQHIVEGRIELIYFSKKLSTKNIICYANDEGKINHLQPNLWFADKKDFICGSIVFLKSDEEGGDITLTNEDVKLVYSEINRNKILDYESLALMNLLNQF